MSYECVGGWNQSFIFYLEVSSLILSFLLWWCFETVLYLYNNLSMSQNLSLSFSGQANWQLLSFAFFSWQTFSALFFYWDHLSLTVGSTTGSSGCGSQGFCTTSATSNRVGRVAGEEGKSGGADARTERNTEGKSFILTAVLLSWHILQLGIVCPWYSSAQEPVCPSAQPGGSKK